MPAQTRRGPASATETRGAAPASEGEGTSGLGNSDFVAMLMSGESGQGAAFADPLRDADDIRESGVLERFKELESRDVRTRESEGVRTIEDDAVLVMKDLAKFTPEQIEEMKKAAYEHDDCKKGLPDAIAKKHYGSERHKQFGALIEQLTGGVISAEEAMAMNPTGGIPGAGADEIPLVKFIEPIARHAMRHDATGFLLNHFQAGPGYGTKTSAIGRDKADPKAGQWLGILREMTTPSALPSSVNVAKSGRFK